MFSVFLGLIFLIVTTKQQITIATPKGSSEGMFAFDTCCLFWNMPYKKANVSDTTVLSTSLKKTPTTIRESVS